MVPTTAASLSVSLEKVNKGKGHSGKVIMDRDVDADFDDDDNLVGDDLN